MDIDALDWATLNRLLAQALELLPADRAPWLATLGDEHAPLLPTLDWLLARAEAPETDDFLHTLPKLDQTFATSLVEEDTGAQIGPYRLLRVLGRGGMASVWLAERNDGALTRQVALKLPRLAAHELAPQFLARERDIVAGLEHPNIARLYDAGLTPSGQPYLAFEYVEGEPIDAYCNSRALDLRKRLHLFLQVARAVAFAHANLVLHRDLKPSNILVTAAGEVRLLDFGIAKLLEDAGGAEQTQVGRALTPDYASPEQILGHPLAVTADVYGLGVVLYELLTGARPYRLKRKSLGALEDAIVSVEPQPPSLLVDDRQRRRQLAGDLDTITLKALRKSPADRYATVPALADDIERFLDGRPVLAQPDRAWYRARKFAARNRIAVTATAAVLLALTAGIAATTWQAVEARHERDSALFQAERALAKGSMFSLLLGALGSAEHPLTQREILERSVTLVESRFRDDPRIAIDLLQPIAGQYMTLGESQKELDVEQRALTLAQKSGDPALIALVACNTVETDIALGRLEAAREQLRIGQQALGQLSRPELGTVTDCLNADAEVARGSGDADRAIDRINEAVLRYEAAGKTRSNRYTSLLAKLSLAYRLQGNPRASYAVLEKLDRADQSAGIPDSADAVARRRDEALILIDLGEYRAAERVLDKVVARLEQAHGDAALPSWLAFTRGVLLLELGDFERARRVLEAATAQARAEGGAQKALPIDYTLAKVLTALGRYDEAENLLAAVEAGLAAAPDRYRSIAPAALRAQLLLARGSTIEAVRTIESELTRLGYPGARDLNQLAAALLTAADAHLAAGDAPRARDLAAAAVEVTQRIARDANQSGAVGRAMLVLARTQRLLGETSTASVTARHAEAGLASGLGNDHPLTLQARALAGS